MSNHYVSKKSYQSPINWNPWKDEKTSTASKQIEVFGGHMVAEGGLEPSTYRV